MLHPNPTASISFKNLQRFVGIIGVALPLVLPLGTLIASGYTEVQTSISDYYYTAMGGVFTGTMILLGATLIFYPAPHPTETKVDYWLTTVAGIFSILVALLPTNYDAINGGTLFSIPACLVRSTIHLVSAVLMLLILSYMSIRIFTKYPSSITEEEFRTDSKHLKKRKRNWWYKVLGYATLISVLGVIIVFAIATVTDYEPPKHYIFWFEVFALVPFGCSWLIKGGLWFRYITD